MLQLLCLMLFVLLIPIPTTAQTMVRNPTVIELSPDLTLPCKCACPDHDQDTGHEIDIVRSDGTVVQTIQGGDPTPDAEGKVSFTINVQPRAFGTYTTVVRATAAGSSSPNSTSSDPWQRSPGSPAKPVAK